MSDSEFETSMSIPLDTGGFLRRECPTCEREFKVYAGDNDNDEEEAEAPPGGYFCPYCTIQAPPDHWWTKEQLEAARGVVAREFVAPELERLGRTLGGRVQIEEVAEPSALTESEDMRQVEMQCHPDRPVKVLEEWAKPVHCFVCGSPA